MIGQFSVCQFFPDGSYEYVRRGIGPTEAVPIALDYCCSVGARIGTTVRVIVTDGDDFITFEWIREKGVVFPPGHEGQLINGQRGGAAA